MESIENYGLGSCENYHRGSLGMLLCKTRFKHRLQFWCIAIFESCLRHGSKGLYRLGLSCRAPSGRGTIDRKAESPIVKPCLTVKILWCICQQS